MSRTRSQAGFTVVEMLVAMMVLGIVIAGALTMMQVVMRQQRGVLDRTESAQQGRLALDQITRQIRSQVCKNETTKGLVDASSKVLTFYADLQSGELGPKPVKRQIEYHEPSHRIIERVYADNGTLTSTRVVLQNVWPTDEDRDGDGQPEPFFSYRAYPVNMTPPEARDVLLGSPWLSAANLGRVARIDINFAVRPTGARPDTKINTPLSDAVVLRNTDPNATKGDPTCI